MFRCKFCFVIRYLCYINLFETIFYFDLLNVVCFLLSHLGPPKRRTTAEEEERAKNPQPEVRNAWFVTAFEFLLIEYS